MAFLQEFKEFAVKGNVVDMAVGVIIGAAFGKIVSSLVGDVVMPAIGMVIGGFDMTQLALTLRESVGGKPAVVVSYGKLLQTMFDFLIIAFAIFAGVRLINRLKRKAPEEPAKPEPSDEVKLLGEIRDLLRSRGT